MADPVSLKIVEAVQHVVRTLQPEGVALLHKPFIGTDDINNVTAVLEAEPVGYGAIEEFEKQLAALIRVKHAIAVSSGTAALHLALLAAGVKSGHHVGMPSLTFAAGAAAVRYCGAVPAFGNTETAVVMTVDLLGELDRNVEAGLIAPGAVIIEDAAEALGSEYGGQRLGSFGHIGILSFNNNKIVTTGGGGAVVTDDDTFAERVRRLATTARDMTRPTFFEHTDVGYNYRMPNVCAALGVGQLIRLPLLLEYKHQLRRTYADAIHAIQPLDVWFKFGKAKSNAWLNAIGVPRRLRDEVLTELWNRDIMARPLFTPLHTQKPYHHHDVTEDERKRSESEFATTVLLPSGRLEP